MASSKGSVLGPLLFVIHINDLPTGLKTKAKIFVDDLKLYSRSDNEKRAEYLQYDLDFFQAWSNKWLLNFHPDKCCVLKLGKDYSNEYFLGSEKRNELKEKYLGVVVDNKISFKDHIAQCTMRANRMVGLIRCFS